MSDKPTAPTIPSYEKMTKEGTYIRVEAPTIPTVEDITQGLKTTNIPSNQEIQSSLAQAKDSIRTESREAKLDTQGQTLARDTEDIIDSASRLISEKNKDERLQSMYKESKSGVTSAVSKGPTGILSGPELKPQSEQLQSDVQNLYEYIRNLSWSFIRSSEFRELTSQWVSYLQSLTTQKIKEQAIKQGGDTTVGQAVAEGLTVTPQPTSQEELEDKTEDQLEVLLTRMASRPEYQNALNDVLRLFDSLNDYYNNISVQQTTEMQHFRRSYEDALLLLGEFTGQKEMEEFKGLIWKDYQAIKSDKDLNDWFYDLRFFVENSFRQPQAYSLEERKLKTKELTRRGRWILNKEKWNRLFDELNRNYDQLILNIKNDSTTRDFTSKLEKFGRDFAFNKEGLPDVFVMEDSLVQLKNLIVPLFKKTLENIPIKRIDVVNDTWDIRVEDIVVDSTSFLPDHLDFRMLNISHLDLKDSEKDVIKHQLLLQVDSIKPVFKQLKFYYRRKSFPKIEDYGMADLSLTGDGALIRVIWTIESKSNIPPRAFVSQIKCSIDKVHINIISEATKHDVLDRMAAPFVAGTLKDKLETTIEDYLKSKLEDLSEQVNEWFLSRPTQQLKVKADKALKQAYAEKVVST